MRQSIALFLFVVATGLPVGGQNGSTSAGAVAGGIFNIRSFGATGDGGSSDTIAINAAIEQCAKAGGGQVLFPPGRYVSGTIHLKSNVTLKLDAGARLIGTTNLNDYARPTPPDYMPEASWGNWHRGLIVGENVENVSIIGPGTIDGAKVFDPKGEERMRGPHTIAFSNCRNFVVRDLTIVDSANYAVFFMVSDNVEFRNVKFVGGWDGIHWRGAPDRWCRNVDIIDCQFYTGDDSIAGRYWDDTVITGCIINSSCNGIRLIGPARNLIIHDNLFFGPGREPHRSSGEKRRTNMLSGIILQPGAWDATEGPLDDVLVTDNTMKNVTSPVTIWSKPGNTIGRVVVDGLKATGVYRSALSVESWAEEPARDVVIRDAQIEFAGGGKAEDADQKVTGPHVDSRPLPAWAVYARNVEKLTLEDIRVSVAEKDDRPVIFADEVGTLTVDDFRFTGNPDVTQTVRTNQVGTLELHDTNLKP